MPQKNDDYRNFTVKNSFRQAFRSHPFDLTYWISNCSVPSATHVAA